MNIIFMEEMMVVVMEGGHNDQVVQVEKRYSSGS